MIESDSNCEIYGHFYLLLFDSESQISFDLISISKLTVFNNLSSDLVGRKKFFLVKMEEHLTLQKRILQYFTVTKFSTIKFLSNFFLQSFELLMEILFFNNKKVFGFTRTILDGINTQNKVTLSNF